MHVRPGSNRLRYVAAIALVMLSCAKATVTKLGENGEGPPGQGGAAAVPPAFDAGGIALPSSDAPAAPPPDMAGELSCAARGQGNAGCDFLIAEPFMTGAAGCYAMVVVNPGTRPAKLSLQRAGQPIGLDQVARLPRGSGDKLTYNPYDNTAGLAPGDVAIIFLTGEGTGPGTGPNDNGCPLGTMGAVAVSTNSTRSSHANGQAFRLSSDQPVVAYDINPFGGIYSYLSSASLLIPVESWSGNYVAAVPPHGVPRLVGKNSAIYDTFVMVVASEDDTEVSVRAPVPIVAGPGVTATAAGQPLRLRLNAGQFVQLMETFGGDPKKPPGMSGTLVSANKPIGVIGGSPCLFIPDEVTACDAAHQQMPPLSSWGHEYAAVSHPTRLLTKKDEPVPWQVVGAVDGTVLTYSPQPPAPYAPPGMTAVPAPTTLAAGQTVQFWTDQAFVVRSQDAAHPIHLAGMMSGADFMQGERVRRTGDPEFVNAVPTDQYLTDVTFFTDPLYPETSLVVTRKPGADGRFADVNLGCTQAPLTGWAPLGPLEYTRVDLVRWRYQPAIPGCDNGVHRMTSSKQFSVTVWGWGSVVSYAYPGGTALRPINDVVIVP
jgi:hypothetical protein